MYKNIEKIINKYLITISFKKYEVMWFNKSLKNILYSQITYLK